MIQYQDWKYSTRILIVDEKNHGSIQVFIPYRDEDKPLDGNTDALIYSLWVDKPYRGHGVAKHLMEVAEKELKKCMIKNVGVSWAFVMLVDEKDGYLGNAIAVTTKVTIKPAIIASLGMNFIQIH